MSSFKFNNVYINNYYSIAGPLERVGKIKNYDLTFKDYYFGEKTFEKAEIKMQKIVIDRLLYNADKNDSEIDLLISGDLSNQIAASSYTARSINTPFLGIYNACASFVESLIIASSFIDNKKISNSICLTSSHNLTAEKNYRFPIEYGSPKKETSTFTATGSVGVLVSALSSDIKVESATIGKVIDYNLKDPNHFGAVMAPAAANTLTTHLKELKRDIDYYDLILTGDLGKVGSKIFLEYLKTNNKIKVKNHMDAGCEIFCDSQNVNSGSSGPATIPLVFFNKVVKSTKYSKILLLATGALHSPLMLNQKESIPAICHALSIEVKR